MAFPKFLLRRVPTGHCNDEFPFDWTCFFTRLIMVASRHLYGGRRGSPVWARARRALTTAESVEFIEAALRSGRPFMAGKIGTGDMETLMRFLDIHAAEARVLKGLKLLAGRRGPFWWDNWIRTGIGVCAGVFPITDANIEDFCRVFMSYCDGFDAVPSWIDGERRIYDALCPNAEIISLEALAPAEYPRTWIGALEGKTVLVVHPYVNTIRMQYEKNVEFNKGHGPLPRVNLKQYRPVNSIGGRCERFAKWKDALDFMIGEISEIDFDVALLGCGVYGIPLSSHIKRMGRQAIYTGGATQTLFGIKGRRWDGKGLYNEHWTRPLPEDVPQNMGLIEGGTFL